MLDVISRSAFDLTAVFETVAESAVKLCGALRAFIYRFDGELLRLAVAYNTPKEFKEFVEQNPIRPGRHTCAARAALERRTIHIPDILADPEYTFGAKAFDKIRTVLGVPILKGDDLLGVMLIYHQEARPFTDNQIALVETFADQAAIAIENLRLLDDLRQRTTDLTEALEQQTATSEVLRVISSSPGELQPVFDAMLENAVRICDGTYGNIYSRDSETFRLVASHKTPPAFTEYRRRNPMTGSGAHWADPMLKSKTQVHIADLALERGFIERDPSFVAAVELGGARSALAVPMLKEGEIIGAFALARQEVRPFTEKQIALVTNLAAQAVIAIENTRLLGELRESLQQQTATADVLKAISRSTFDLRAVLDTLVESAARLCEAQTSFLFRRDGANFIWTAGYGHTPEYLEQWKDRPVPPNRGSAVGRAAAEGTIVHIPDVFEDPEYTSWDSQKAGRYRSVLGVPLLREGIPIGVLGLTGSKPRSFSNKQIELVTTFADQAAIAIENVRLFNEVQARTSELQETLEYQTAASDVLNVISRSPSNIQPVLEVIAETAQRLCHAEQAYIMRLDGGLYHLAAAKDARPERIEYLKNNPIVADRGSVTGRVAIERRTIHITDAQLDPEYTLDMDGDAGYRTILGVPLIREGAPIGVIILTRGVARPFAEKQIELVTTFADQAVIAIENARLLNELRQRTDDLTEFLEQQTATSEILEVISNSPTDSQPAFDAIVRSGLRLFPKGVVVISLPDGDHVKLAAIAGADADDREKLRARYPLGLSREYITSTAIVDARELDFADAREAPVELIRGARNFLASGYRGITVVPMLRGDTAIGAISIVRRQPGALTEKQRELLRTFASQAVIAIENTRLFHELRARTDDLSRSVEELRALGEVSQAVNSTLDLETVLSTIVTKAVQLSRTDAGAIYVFDDGQREFRLRATYGMDQELITALTHQHIGLDEPNVAAALAHSEPIQVSDLQEEAQSDLNEITLRAGYRARLVSPLIRGEKVVGLLVVRRRMPGAFPQNTVDLIKTFAAQSTVAIENAALIQECGSIAGGFANYAGPPRPDRRSSPHSVN